MIALWSHSVTTLGGRGPAEDKRRLLIMNTVALNETVLAGIRAAFVALGDSNYTEAIDAMEQPHGWQTWVVGLGFVSLCSFSAPLGILLLPCLSKSLYERIMALLIALGIGTLSGSCFFIMIPQAFGLTRVEGGLGYPPKSWIIVGSLYAFFTVDRLLQYFMEFRRRRNHRRVHISALNKSIERRKRDSERRRQETVETVVTDVDGFSRAVSNSSADSDDESKRNELEVAVLNNVIARRFSTRRSVAVVKAVDGIEYVDGRSAATAPSSPKGTFKKEKLDDGTLRRVNSDLNHLSDLPSFNSRSHSTEEDTESCADSKAFAIPGKREKGDDEISVSVEVVEKHVVDPGEMEVANIAYIIILGSSANNFLDGMSMGAAFADSLFRGVSIGVAAFSQQFPQELGTLAILVNSGLGLKRTLLINLIPNFLSYLGFVVGVLLDNVDESYDSYVFAVSAGMYLYVFLGTLIPEIRETTEQLIKTNIKESYLVSALQFIGIGGGVTFMYFMNKIGGIEIS